MHAEDIPPQRSALVTCPCCLKTYRYAGKQIRRGTPKQNQSYVRKQPAPRFEGALLVAASLVAAIRLRGEEIKPSPKLNAVVQDSIALARTVLAKLEQR